MICLNYKSGEKYSHMEMYCHLIANEMQEETFSRAGCRVTDEGDSVALEIPNKKVQLILNILQSKLDTLMFNTCIDLSQDVDTLRDDTYVSAQQAVLYACLRLDILNEWCNNME